MQTYMGRCHRQGAHKQEQMPALGRRTDIPPVVIKQCQAVPSMHNTKTAHIKAQTKRLPSLASTEITACFHLMCSPLPPR